MAQILCKKCSFPILEIEGKISGKLKIKCPGCSHLNEITNDTLLTSKTKPLTAKLNFMEGVRNGQ